MRRDQVRRRGMAVAGEIGCEASRLAAAQPRGFRQRFLALAAAFDADGFADHRHHDRDVGFVDRAGVGDQIAKCLAGAFAIAREAVDRFRILPSAVAREPERRGEMVERHHRHDAFREAAGDHAAVMIERGLGEEAFLRLDARPFDGEAIDAEAELLQHRDVARIEMIVIAGVARRILEQRVLHHLHQPEIAGRVAALDLMRRGRRAPQKAFRKRAHPRNPAIDSRNPPSVRSVSPVML